MCRKVEKYPFYFFISLVILLLLSLYPVLCERISSPGKPNKEKIDYACLAAFIWIFLTALIGGFND